MNKLRNFTRRSTLFLMAVGFLASLGLGSLTAYVMADPFFTSEFSNRSLTLTSSSPGWAFTDGAGNSGPSSNAPAGSGANGKQTGEKFTFDVNTDHASTSESVTTMTLEYCTSAAGTCVAPGNGVLDPSADPPTSDLDAHYNGTLVEGSNPATDNFDVLWKGGESANWTMAATQSAEPSDGSTAVKNFIKLTCDTTAVPACTPIPADHGDSMELDFWASNTNYITNPGAGAFFVRLADYSALTPLDGTTEMDAGVTVANVVNQSIQITTKVLETMTFSVGVADPDTEALSGPSAHGSCDTLDLTAPGAPSGTPDNAIALGDSSQEYSLSTTQAYDAYSLWRLSSNSAYGASVYYSGDTLRSTEGSFIDGIGDGTTAAFPLAGTNQFGLALNPDYSTDGTTYPTGAYYSSTNPLSANYLSAYATNHGSGDGSWILPGLDGLQPQDPYADGDGTLRDDGSGALHTNPEFGFSSTANTDPVLIADESSSVINCSTGQVRYVADVAGNTAAGIYTTKINFLAAPEY